MPDGGREIWRPLTGKFPTTNLFLDVFSLAILWGIHVAYCLVWAV